MHDYDFTLQDNIKNYTVTASTSREESVNTKIQEGKLKNKILQQWEMGRRDNFKVNAESAKPSFCDEKPT